MTGPSDVSPVMIDGVRYEALHWGKQRDLGQNGGFVVAYDAATGDELWVQKIYDIVYGDKSPQKYDLFIRDLTAIEDGQALRITDESGRVHKLDLATRTVSVVIEPVTGPARSNPRKPPTQKAKSLLGRLFGG